MRNKFLKPQILQGDFSFFGFFLRFGNYYMDYIFIDLGKSARCITNVYFIMCMCMVYTLTYKSNQ